MTMRRGLLKLALVLDLTGSAVFGAGGLFIVDGVPQRHVGLASQAYVDAHMPALSVAASNATRLIQIDTQAWVTVTGGTATLWQVATSTQLVCSGAGTLAVNGRYDGSVASGYFENTANANITVIGEDDAWFVYWNGGGGWLYHCFGSESPVGGAWAADAGSEPVPTFTLVEVLTTNVFSLARVADITNGLAQARWVPTVIASAPEITLSVANGNLQFLAVTDAATVIHPPAAAPACVQAIDLEIYSGQNAVTWDAAISNATSITLCPTMTNSVVLRQAFGCGWWKAVQINP